MRIYPQVGIQAAKILIPGQGVDLQKWAVVACDQFTSEPDYWKKIEESTTEIPSSYHLILPEAYLGNDKSNEHTAKINPAMKNYLKDGIFTSIEGFIYIEREINSGTRKGLIVGLDLDQYDFSSRSTSLIRATEGTIIDRLPPRISIREKASLEIPHILVLIDDPGLTVIEPVSAHLDTFKNLYDFELMANGGHLRGYLVNDLEVERSIIKALQMLASNEQQKIRYGSGENPLLYAVGDGNHSLAAAKSIWEKIRGTSASHHPARYALVELVNIHDPSIIFEPIHRLLMNVSFDLREKLISFFNGNLVFNSVADFEKMKTLINSGDGRSQSFGLVFADNFSVGQINSPRQTLTVGSIQKCIDFLIERHDELKIDYIHGDDSILELSQKPGNAGFFLPPMDKFKLFESVIKDGPLPRKTFSMGEAHEKRYYLECRLIKGE